MSIDRRLQGFERYSRAVDAPLMVLAVAMIPLLILPAVIDLTASAETTLVAIDYLIWGVFTIDYVVRIVLAPARWRFIRTHPFDLLIVVLPLLRPLRIVRSARVLPLLRALRLASLLARSIQTARGILRRRGLNYVILIVLGVSLISAAVVREAERGVEGSNIGSFADALWWVATTVTTVGYGDRFPVSAAGRGVAVALMVMGISLLGVLTASIAAYFVESERSDRTDEVLTELKAINARLNVLEAQDGSAHVVRLDGEIPEDGIRSPGSFDKRDLSPPR